MGCWNCAMNKEPIKVYVVFGHAWDYESHLRMAIYGFYDKKEADKACEQLNVFAEYNREYELKLDQFKLEWEEKHPILFAKELYNKDYSELTAQEQKEYDELDQKRFNDLKNVIDEYNEQHYQLPSELLKFHSLLKKLSADFINDIYTYYNWQKIEFRVEELNIFTKAENIEV